MDEVSVADAAVAEADVDRVVATEEDAPSKVVVAVDDGAAEDDPPTLTNVEL